MEIKPLSVVSFFQLVGLFACEEEFKPEMKPNNFKKKKYSIQVLFIALLAACSGFMMHSCEEPFTLEIDPKYNEQLVVDGMITNEPGPYTVSLSLSSPLGTNQFFPLSGYQVFIEEENGVSELLVESENGVYISSADGIQGIEGEKYRVRIQSPDGKNYQSDYEILQPALPIQEVYYEVEYTSVDYFPFDLPGYRFYVDGGEAQQDTLYLMWNLEETWEYESDFKIFYSYYDRIVHPVQNIDTLKTCWATRAVNGFYFFTTEGFSSPEVVNYPLHIVNTDTRKLSIRYSLLTRQMTLTRNAYKYWQKTVEQSTENDQLYTKQPFQVHGNVYNINNPEEPVLGYFATAGISSIRIFVNRPPPTIEMYYQECFLSENDYFRYGSMFNGPGPDASDPIYVTEDEQGARAVPHPACLDCRMRGGKLEKPDFWIDE